MNNSNLIVPGMMCCLFMAGCVATTSGPVTEPVRDDADASTLNYQLGARYYKQGSYELARDRLMRAIEIDPKMAVAYTALALTYEALENQRLATQAYETAIRVAPRDFNVQNAYAVFLCRQKDYSKAARYFDKAISHEENDNAQIMMVNAGMCMTEKPDVGAAEAYFRDALARKPNFGDALIQMCLLKYKQKDYLGARAFLQRYMSSNISTAGVLYLASRIEDMLDNDRGRTKYEDQLIHDFPTSPEARKVLGTG